MFEHHIKTWLAFVFFCLTYTTFVNAQHNSATIVWQGFQHQWKYDNHRYKRMGSYVSAPMEDAEGYQAEIVNTAASGIGADVMNYATWFTKVKTTDVFFDTQDSVEIPMIVCSRDTITKNDHKGVVIQGNFDFTYPLPEAMQNKENYMAFLNGFDLYHVRNKTGRFYHPAYNAVISTWSQALKFNQLDIRIADTRINQQEETYTVTIALALTADCKTGECPKVESFCLDYAFNVPFTLAAGDADALRLSSPKNLYNAYDWEKETRVDEFKKRKSKRKNYYARRYHPNEIVPEKKGVWLESTYDETLQVIPVISAIGFETIVPQEILDKDENAYHLAELRMAIFPAGGQSPGQDSYYYDYMLFFKQWQTDMRWLSHANPGAVEINMNVVPLQFLKETELEYGQTNGQIRWKTNPVVPLSAKSSKAVKRKVVRVE